MKIPIPVHADPEPENDWGKKVKRLLDERTSVNLETGCWEYQGVNADGYGQITINYVFYYVHRLSAMIFHGYNPLTVAVDMNVLHRCDNRCCWNPQHLYIGSLAENNADIQRAGNARGKYSDVTHCVNGHEFTESNTYRVQRPTGEWRRMCRECRKISDQKRKAKMKMVKFGEVG